jgi:hypothetical protein
MPKPASKFVQNQLVTIKGRKATARVHWPVVMQCPTIINGAFSLEERMMYKFIEGKETFYAWEEDLTAAKPK